MAYQPYPFQHIFLRIFTKYKTNSRSFPTHALLNEYTSGYSSDCYAPTTPEYTENPFHFLADAWQTSDAACVPLHMGLLLKPERIPGIAAAHFLPNIAHNPALQTTSMRVYMYPDIPRALAFSFSDNTV